ERARPRAAQRLEMRAAAELPPDVVRERAHVGPLRAVDADPRLFALEREDVEAVDRDRALLALDLDAPSRVLVERFALVLHRRHHGRELADLAAKRPERGFQRLA